MHRPFNPVSNKVKSNGNLTDINKIFSRISLNYSHVYYVATPDGQCYMLPVR